MGRSPRLTSKDMTRQELPIPSTSLRNFIAEGRQNRPSDKIKVTKLTSTTLTTRLLVPMQRLIARSLLQFLGSDCCGCRVS
jgi:hypothetical protein